MISFVMRSTVDNNLRLMNIHHIKLFALNIEIDVLKKLNDNSQFVSVQNEQTKSRKIANNPVAEDIRSREY